MVLLNLSAADMHWIGLSSIDEICLGQIKVFFARFRHPPYYLYAWVCCVKKVASANQVVLRARLSEHQLAELQNATLRIKKMKIRKLDEKAKEFKQRKVYKRGDPKTSMWWEYVQGGTWVDLKSRDGKLSRRRFRTHWTFSHHMLVFGSLHW